MIPYANGVPKHSRTEHPKHGLILEGIPETETFARISFGGISETKSHVRTGFRNGIRNDILPNPRRFSQSRRASLADSGSVSEVVSEAASDGVSEILSETSSVSEVVSGIPFVPSLRFG